MGGKKRVAASMLLVVLLLLPGELPGMSAQARVIVIKPPFSVCYDPCYSDCREHDQQPKVVCHLRCWLSCAGALAQRDSQEVAAAADTSAFAGGSDGACGKEKGCLMASVSCGTAATGGNNGPAGADVAACLDGAAPPAATTGN
ncbi:hypothetical protein BS78_06G067500 [Paspalum vaginatum]|nr:hypothetical protein BS78_06G067500 [Paspalum vaginatum]